VASARGAIRLFGDALRPFGGDDQILPGVRAVGAAARTPGTPPSGRSVPEP
jgi:hypothetical protein